MNTSHRRYEMPTRSRRLHIRAMALSYGAVFGASGLLYVLYRLWK